MSPRSTSSIIGVALLGIAAAGLLGPSSYAADTSSTPAATNASAMPAGESIAKGSDCFSCHAIDQKIVGPSFDAVAGKFAGKSGAEATLTDAIKNGHVGTWGQVPMPAHPQLSDAKIKQIVTWILTLKPSKTGAAGGAPAAATKTYSYKVGGKTVTTSFPIYQTGTTKVTPVVFNGYELFNSYCFRCHGEDAVGGSFAPNLRRSLNNGMSESKFVSIAMTGVKAKGMPSWAGFFTPKQIKAIYQYTKARAVAVVATGTPDR